jgi:hypothetical protein
MECKKKTMLKNKLYRNYIAIFMYYLIDQSYIKSWIKKTKDALYQRTNSTNWTNESLIKKTWRYEMGNQKS